MGQQVFSITHDIYDQARPWQWRVLRASISTETGLIVMAMLARKPRHGWAFGQTADIRIDGFVETDLRTPEGTVRPKTIIGSIIAVRDNMRRLADHCKLSDADREAMFAELRKWIRKDYRARSEI